MTGLIAKKIGMSRVFLQTGEAVPVTYLKVEPNVVIRTKSQEKDGYNAVVLGVGGKPWKSRKGKAHTRYALQKEWRVESLEGLAPGKAFTCQEVPVASVLTITGVSKGKGFQGVMKRHNFAGGPGSHGSHFKREPGSIGMRTQPGRIHKGKRMAGRMGGEQITIKGRAVLACDTDEGVIAVKGPVPGSIGSFVYLTIERAPESETPSETTPS